MSKPSDQVFYASVTVNLRLRFDESMKVTEIPDIPEPLDATGIADAVSGASGPLVRPLITQKGKDNLSFVMNRVPRMAHIELPAYRQAGKFSLEFDWRELPIDPRLLRAIGIEIYVGSVDPSDFATGMTSIGQDGRRRSVLQTQDAAGAPKDDLLALCGVVDTWAVTHGEGSTIKMEGRDLRGVLLDSPINPNVVAKIDLTRPLVVVIADIMRAHPAAQYMKILYNPDDWPNGVPPPCADREGMTRVRQGAARGSTPATTSDKPKKEKVANETAKGLQGGSSSDTTSFWDLITRYCFLVGAIPFFRGRNLIIRPARSIFDQSKPVGQEASGLRAGLNKFNAAVTQFGTGGLVQSTEKTWDPVFGGNGVRIDDDGRPFTVRKFVYGRNVKELSFERKFTGVKVPVIELVSYDTSSTNRGKAKLLIAQWPPEDEKLARMSGVSPSGEVSQTDRVQISVPGVRDLKQLTSMARDLYEEIGRGEMGGSCKTGFLSSYKGSNADPDICRLRPGHAVEFSMDTRQLSSTAPAANTKLALDRSSFEDAVKQIKRSLGSSDENLARVIVASSRSAVLGQMNTFRSSNVVFSWDLSAGLQTSFDFQNYLVVRHDVGEKLGANTTPAVETTVARTPKKAPPVNVAPGPSNQPGAGQFNGATGFRKFGGIKEVGNGFIEVPVVGFEPFPDLPPLNPK